jgi:hypothetical protein
MKFYLPQFIKTVGTGIFLIALAVPTAPQQLSGSLQGTVTDQLGGLILSATVSARSNHGVERTTTTDSSGKYEFRSLAPGRYDLKVIASGFEGLEEKNLEIKSGKTLILDLHLSIGSLEQTVTIDNKSLSTDADRNADATILRERELEALPNEPEALAAALQAMAGPGQGENGPQMKVDGFSNGQIPPKEAIREVRINQNPYSAENEYPGWGGIEIYTQPGSEKFHGGGSFNFNDESLNSRNPFALVRAPYQLRFFNGNLTGPVVKKRASFALYLNRYEADSNAVINATILDSASLKPVLFNQTLVTPSVRTNFTLRSDLKLNKKHTLVGNYEFSDSAQNPQGVGGFSLPSRAYQSHSRYHNLQLTETAVINEKTINETRLQLNHSVYRQTASSALPALNVLDSFFGGGAQIGNASSATDRAELQNFTSWQTGHHFIKIGGRFRYVRIRNISPSDFGGTYTFAGGQGPALDANNQVIPGAPIEITSLESYRRTLLFQRQGLSAAQIRSLGGGATQFSIAGGNPEADVDQSDISFYLQDEWKVKPHFTLSPGLRYENQNNINSNLNFAPRIAFAWSPIFGHQKTTPAVSDSKDATQAKSEPPKPVAPRQPKIVVRGGFGIFYNRIGEEFILQSLRFNGLNQKQFLVTDPSVLDLFPAVPQISLLNAFAQPQTRRVLSAGLAPSYSLRGSLSVENQITKNLKLTLNYSYSRSLRTLRTVNINAPLAGSFNPAQPNSGLRPFGQNAGNILESESNGHSRYESFSLGVNGRVAKINLWGSYSLNSSRSTDNGTSGSSFDPYDFTHEWGRAGFDIRHWLWAGADYQTRSGFGVNTFIVANSGGPFNIITGHDTNGDTLFTERPALATDLNKPGVIVTPLGALDPNPSPGQTIIPRNFGQAPGFLSVNVGVSKVIKFGRAIQPQNPLPAATNNTVVATGPAVTNQKTPAKPQVQRPYQLSFSMYATNALNHVNQGLPIGNMASPYFLKSTGTSGIFFFGPGGGGSGGNRQISLRVRLSF